MMRMLIFAAAAGCAALSMTALAPAAHAQRALEGADANNDGVITRAEFIAHRNSNFDRMDRNNDGVITANEFGRLRAASRRIGEQLDRVIRAADANHDGRVTRAEFAHAPTTMFDLADANNDGRVDRDEMAAARARAEQMRASR